jgi:hypothetical protein
MNEIINQNFSLDELLLLGDESLCQFVTLPVLNIHKQEVIAHS